jgi:hypothetical protein
MWTRTGSTRIPEQGDAPIVEGMNGEQQKVIQKMYNTYTKAITPRPEMYNKKPGKPSRGE